jgi:uncharacterized protein (TIGR03435 family)
MRTPAVCVALGIALGGIGAAAQTPTSSTGPRFDVASVKLNTSGDPHGTAVVQPGGRYMAVNVPVEQLIAQAYGLQSGQLVGGQGWTRTERFDVTAKADGEITTDAVDGPGSSRLQRMLQALLAERFALVVHRDTREQPVYALVLARNDQALGPKMRVSTTDCAAALAAHGRAGGPAPGPLDFTAPVTCALRMGHGVLVADAATMGQLAVSLSAAVQRVVHDHTGLTGRYDMDMSFTPERMPQALSADPDGTSIFTALQEQLGLKLDSTRASVEVVVVDGVERPMPD